MRLKVLTLRLCTPQRSLVPEQGSTPMAYTVSYTRTQQEPTRRKTSRSFPHTVQGFSRAARSSVRRPLIAYEGPGDPSPCVLFQGRGANPVHTPHSGLHCFWKRAHVSGSCTELNYSPRTWRPGPIRAGPEKSFAST